MAKKPIDLFGRKGEFPVNLQSGTAPQQVNINLGPDDITFKTCEQCGNEFFDAALRMGILSSVNPKNPTGKDMPIQVPVLRMGGWDKGGC